MCLDLYMAFAVPQHIMQSQQDRWRSLLAIQSSRVQVSMLDIRFRLLLITDIQNDANVIATRTRAQISSLETYILLFCFTLPGTQGGPQNQNDMSLHTDPNPQTQSTASPSKQEIVL